MLRKDDLKMGVMLGLIAPLFGFVIYYFIARYMHNITFSEFVGYLKRYKSVLTGVSSLSLIANAVLFTVYINSHRDKTAKGIFVATLIYGITVLLVKLIR